MENEGEGALPPVLRAHRLLDLAQDYRPELDVTWLVDAVNIAEGGRKQVAPRSPSPRRSASWSTSDGAL